MINFLKNKLKKPTYPYKDAGTLKRYQEHNCDQWFGTVRLSISEIPMELTIEVEKGNEPSQEQLSLIEEFESNWEALNNRLFQYMYDAFRNSQWEKEKEELQKMYYLCSIELKRNTSEWWIVMEAKFDVASIFNFLPRFTIEDNEIVWSNFT